MLGRCVGFRGSMKAFLRNEFLQINLDDVDTATRSPPSPPSTHLVNKSSNGFGSNSNGGNHYCSPREYSPPSDLSLAAKLLHLFLEFPLLNGEDSGSPDREKLFSLLRSFAADNAAATAPVHLIFFPEAWSLHNNTNGQNNGTSSTDADRRAILAKSNEFAKREGKPQLKCLLLPRTRVFNASLECLRESNPLLYDVTMVSARKKGDRALCRDTCSVLMIPFHSTLLGIQWLRRFTSLVDATAHFDKSIFRSITKKFPTRDSYKNKEIQYGRSTAY
jgi:hypothetical protein